MPIRSTACAAATATASAVGRALPTSSLARITIRRRDERRVLAALEHHRQVVERGVDVGSAHRLDVGRDVVVVAVAGTVVERRAALHRVGGAPGRDLRLAVRRGRGRGAARAPRSRPARRPARRRRAARSPPPSAAGRRRAASSTCQLGARQGPQRIDAAAREQRRVDLERRVLGRRPDQDHRRLPRRPGSSASCWALLKRWISSRNRTVGGPPAGAAQARALDHVADLGAAGLHGAELLERPAARGAEHPRERRLARPGRPGQDHRMGPALLDRAAQRRSRRQQLLLADELVESKRPCSDRERVLAGRLPVRTVCPSAEYRACCGEGCGADSGESPEGAAFRVQNR